MDIAKFTAEDFVLDPSFRKWVVNPDAATKIKWEKLLEKNPHQYEAAEQARDIILHLSIKNHLLEHDDKSKIWKKIALNLDEDTEAAFDDKIVPLDAKSTLGRKSTKPTFFNRGFWWRVACLFFLSLSLLYIFNRSEEEEPSEIPKPIYYVERNTPPGVKSNLLLSDGSKIILNSNSNLKFQKQFDSDKREVFLEGEAFFDIAEDTLRPFYVHVGQLHAVVLGTSFNIKAYDQSKVDIALVSGEVLLEERGNDTGGFLLAPGQMARINNGRLQVTGFDKELILGWTMKLILFKETPMDEAIQVLENWYGVKIHVSNRPKSKVTFSGKFQDETLKNVLLGLSYVAGFKFSIHQNEVEIKFNN
jgi:ferric-dicitrate binding protein FerR (iron transport regulator)